MRILSGKKVIEAPPKWREAITASRRPVIIDLGAGDGRYVYESARDDPGALYIGIDPDPDTLAEYAFRASRKAARGGVDNATFVVAPAEALPEDVGALATLVRVNFPWGSLMRGLLEPRPEMLREIAALLAPAGVIEVVTSYDPEHDTGAFAGEALPPLDEAYLRDHLTPAYEAEGFELVYRRMTRDEAIALASTWGRRLLHARPREVYFLTVTPRAQDALILAPADAT